MEGKKPYNRIETVKDWIYFQYATVMARSIIESRGEHAETRSALNSHFGLIVSQYNDLKSGRKNMSDYLNDSKKALKLDRKCIYCGSEEGELTFEHIIPRKVIGEAMANHEHNLVLSCRECNTSKSARELISWWEAKFGADQLPRKHVLSKYLKFLYRLHHAQGTLNHPWSEWDTAIFRTGARNQ